MKTKKIHYSTSESLLFRIDNYAKEKHITFRSSAITELITIALDNLDLLTGIEDIKKISITQLGYLKTIEDLNKILISALDITSYKSPSSNPVIQQYFKNKKDGTND